MFENTAIYKFFWCRMITGMTDIFGIVKHEYQTEYEYYYR